MASTSISTIEKEKFVTQRKEEYMAEMVLDDVDRFITKAFSLATEHIIFKEFKNLLDILYKIKFVLHQKRQISDESVGIWLMKLRKVAYEVDNVLDEFDSEIIQQKVQLQNQMIDQVRSFSFCSHDKVKTIKQSLDELVNDVAGFGLRTESLKSIIKIRLDKNEDSFLNDSEVVGREFDVVKILNELISSSNQQVISVLPIVGMAGLGKTTLAKVLYSHEEIKKHFDALAWVHVSENFDVEKISREIRESLKIESTSLGSRNYFLVLDDIWIKDCDKWDILRSRLEDIIHPNDRINIIVTTSSKEIAQIVKTLPPYHLEKLSKDDCWSILKKRAFADEGKSLTFDLEASGREIARRCGGVPLVARVVGGTMCFKCDKNEWLAIEKDNNWYLLDDNNNDIFSVLKLCFDHLPTPSLKQCFAYCAIFPKDYDIEKDEVIQYWMAEGFLELAKEANMVMEDIGNLYFNILLATSFFQNARKDAYGNIIGCKMHDLVHDFALSISKLETLTLERDSMDNISNVQHLFVRSDGITRGTSFSGECLIKLRTLISENFDFEDILSKFKFLRVLKLSGDLDTESITELSDSIEHLIHLRLLHTSNTYIQELPKSITKLYHLQTLRIESPIKELPKDLSNLINLRHIHINHPESDIIEMPKNMGTLTCLQTLSIFAVGQEEGYQIRELGALKNLKGEINIENLENVKDEEEAKSAKLKEKEIFNLGLRWTSEEEEDRCEKDKKVLEGLQPHPNLKSLTIQCYLGKKFPSWVGLSSLYHNLIEINLRDCWECEEVPTLGQLPCLRVLEIYYMVKVRSIGSEFYFYSDGSYRNSTTLFPALRILKLEQMDSLEEWKDAKELTTADEVLFVFPCLEELIIRRCYKLRYLPDSLRTCVSLQKLVVIYCPELRSLPGVRSIIRCGIEDPPSGLQCIEYLENGPSTSSIHRSLQKLNLYGPHFLLLDQIRYFIALKILWIQGFYEIGALPEWLGNLSSLQKLYIVDCKNLVHLPTKEAMRRLTQLKMLEIYRCPNLEDNEQSKTDHIPFVNIRDYGRPDDSDFYG